MVYIAAVWKRLHLEDEKEWIMPIHNKLTVTAPSSGSKKKKKKPGKELNITTIDVQQTTKRLFSLLAEKYISPFIPLIIKYAFFF